MVRVIQGLSERPPRGKPSASLEGPSAGLAAGCPARGNAGACPAALSDLLPYSLLLLWDFSYGSKMV